MPYGLQVDKRLVMGTNAGKFLRVRNNSGGARSPGEVVIWDTTVTYPAITTTTSTDDAKVAGVVVEAIPTLKEGRIQVEGKLETDNLYANGTTAITAGDMLSTYSSAGIAQKATAGKAGVFAIALEAYAVADSAGRLSVMLIPAGRQDASATVSYGVAGTMAADGLAAANNAGVAASASRTDHVHTNTADTPALTLGTSNSAGTAGSVLAANASVAIFDATVPGTIAVAASAAAGTAAVAARRDHVHGMVAGAAPADGSLAAANAAGTATTVSLSDHAHKSILANDVPVILGTTDAAASAARIEYDTAETNDALKIGVNTASRRIIVEDYGDMGSDSALAAATDPTITLLDATAAEFMSFDTDTTGGRIDVSTGNNLALAVAGTDEHTFDASNYTLASGNFIKFAGDNGIKDSGGNEVLEVSATASATNGLLVKNAATADPVIISAQGTGATANRGIRFNDSNGNEALILVSVASAVNELTTSNTATGNPVILANNGEDDIGFVFNAKNAEAMLSLRATAAATTRVDILSMSTGTTGPAISALGETNVNLRLIPNGTGQLNVAPGTAGTAARPDIVLGGDVDSGIYGGTNIIGIATAGSPRFYIDAAGIVILGASQSTSFTASGGSLVFDEISAPTGTATNQAQIYAYDSATVTVMAQQKSDGTNADL